MVTVSDRVVQKDVGTFTLICPQPNPNGPTPPCFYNQDNANPDGIVDYYEADVITANDYYPFGMNMPGRNYKAVNLSPAEGYRYGFNGKEQDKETTGTTTFDYGFRIYNPALGKFLSVDPLVKDYPMLTPYQFASNSPILYIDIDGLEGGKYIMPDGTTVLLPTNATNISKSVSDKDVNVTFKDGSKRKASIKEGQLKSFQIGDRLFEAYWYKNGSFAGYYNECDEKYVPEQQANIGVVQMLDEVIIMNCALGPKMPLTPPSNQDCAKKLWELPIAFQYSGVLDKLMPDAISTTGQASLSFGGTVEAGITSTQILKGPSKCWFVYHSASYGVGANPTSIEAEAEANVGLIYNISNKPFTRENIAGKSISFTLGVELKAPFVLAGVGFGGSLGIELSVKNHDLREGLKNEVSSITIKGGITAAAGASTGVTGSATFGESTPALHICPFNHD